MFAVLFK